MKSLVSKSLVSLVAYGFVNMASAAVIHYNCETDILKKNWHNKSVTEVSRADISLSHQELSSRNWFDGDQANIVTLGARAKDIQSILEITFADLEVDHKGITNGDYSELSFVHPEREIVPIATQIDSSEANVSVPEPATFGMVLLGLLGLGFMRRRMATE